MDKTKIYIAGQITGLPLKDAEVLFSNAEKWIEQHDGTPVNPLRLCAQLPDKEWHEYMAEGMAHLLQCKGIYMLIGWEKSRGARIEREVAKEMGFMILYEEYEDSTMAKKKK